MAVHKKRYKAAPRDNTARLVINAANVHNGGGAELLIALIKTKPDFVFADQRFQLPKELTHFTKIKYIKPNLTARFKHELSLNKFVNSNDIVLFFGNLPPLFPINAHSVVFVQNRYLIDSQSINNFDFKTKLRIVIERLWLYHRRNACGLYCVQTHTMANLLREKFKNKHINIQIKPFIDINKNKPLTVLSEQLKIEKNGFIYAASGEPHKNHDKLIKAWVLLSEMGYFPKLKLTLDENQWPSLCSLIETKKKQFDLDIENLGFLKKDILLEEYRRSAALIYPSKFESFGIPLVEAKEEGTAIIAPELDYVRDIVQPIETFDADSELSIARSVMRFISDVDDTLETVSVQDFVKNLRDEFLET
ncbi:glycosyltransferase [Lentilitoribacter sp. EG35]|uniref:glycosyltransferase n=1 Tax=Lentilitoribacter sp. EG35 TaxID=3234192 RepID=UPI0034602352